MPACANCGFVNHPELPARDRRNLIRVAIEDSGVGWLCDLCTLRLIANLDDTHSTVTLWVTRMAAMCL